MIETDRLLSTKQAAEASGFHQTHFNAIISDGKLPATKDERGRWQIKQSDLDKYLASKTVKPRRQKQYTNTGDVKSEASLLTQLDHKTKAFENLQMELDSAKLLIEDNKAKHHVIVTDLRAAVAEGELKLQRAKKRIERIETENHDLRLEIKDHNDFLRTTLKEVLQSIMGK